MIEKIGFWLGGAALVLAVALTVQTAPAADYYFGNFETDVQYEGQYILDRSAGQAGGYRGWFDWDYNSLPPKNASPSWEDPSTPEREGYGITTGDYSIAYQPSKTGYDQGLAVHFQDLPTGTRNTAFQALLTHTQIAMNVAWNNDNFDDPNPSWYEQYGGSGWNGAEIGLAINYGPTTGGWHDEGRPDIDTGNPTNQGRWDLTSYPNGADGSPHIRVVTWDYSAYLPQILELYNAGTMNETNGWFELMVYTNQGDYALPVTYYFDSWRFTNDIAPPVLNGDYNDNGTIDAADYTVWRDVFSAGGTELTNDPTPGTVDETDFDYWKAHFGETGPGAGALTGAAVPEPATVVLVIAALAFLPLVARRWR